MFGIQINYWLLLYYIAFHRWAQTEWLLYWAWSKTEPGYSSIRGEDIGCRPQQQHTRKSVADSFHYSCKTLQPSRCLKSPWKSYEGIWIYSAQCHPSIPLSLPWSLSQPWSIYQVIAGPTYRDKQPCKLTLTHKVDFRDAPIQFFHLRYNIWGFVSADTDHMKQTGCRNPVRE